MLNKNIKEINEKLIEAHSIIVRIRDYLKKRRDEYQEEDKDVAIAQKGKDEFYRRRVMTEYVNKSKKAEVIFHKLETGISSDITTHFRRYGIQAKNNYSLLSLQKNIQDHLGPILININNESGRDVDRAVAEYSLNSAMLSEVTFLIICVARIKSKQIVKRSNIRLQTEHRAAEIRSDERYSACAHH